MTSGQLQQLDQRLSWWRASHAGAARVRAVYRQQVLRFTLNICGAGKRAGKSAAPGAAVEPTRH